VTSFMIWGMIPGMVKKFFFPPKCPISSEAHPASYSMGTVGYFLRGKASRARS